MLNYRLGTVNEKHWGLNQFSAAKSQHSLLCLNQLKLPGHGI